MRRIQGATAALLLVLAACSSIESPPSAVDSGTQPSADLPSGVLQEVSAIGVGRALQAASAAGAATVVATTIGVSVVDENGGSTPSSPDVDPPASEITVSPDGRYATVEGPGRTELWSIEAAPRSSPYSRRPRTRPSAPTARC